ncbi:unnamed protein product [Caenorhabditis sp. 36 PRJEB53466]|nr:unnamed protein product [Caenorhabditis sp. 36 PRJEB53466]
MSSGLPPILASAQPAANAFSFNNGLTPFGYFFPQIPGVAPNGQLSANTPNSASLNRFKVKRHRQRVDAGEPRNTYQGTTTTTSSSSSITSNSSATSSATSSSIQFTPKFEKREEAMTPSVEAEAPIGEQENTQEEDVSVSIEAAKPEEGDNESGGMFENDDVIEEEFGERESPGSNSSSASKRKCFLPQKIGEQLGIEIGEETEQIHVTVGGTSEEPPADEPEEAEAAESKELSAIRCQLQNGNFAESQRRVYAAFIEQQRKQVTASQMGQLVQANKINFDLLISMLKNEIVNGLAKNMEKVVRDWMADEMAKLEAAQVTAPPPPFHPMFANNPLFHLPTPHPVGGGGIFPTNFNAFNALSALRKNFQENEMENRRKRKLDMKREEVMSSRASPLSASASPPLGRFFQAPTMVAHPYGAMNFVDREDSPTNSDELSDCGFEGNGSNSQLTPMHLRKAKLMFFYTRYPNSNLLKSYFPDIRFNKNNTAQLVKWFSNFREFYYIQMEKFGRQLLAEGVRDRSEIFVTKDSELFKVLNTHYNRNNHIKPPDRLVLVVQETLREFYDAIKLGKDAEPSWKKTIYKVINRMDDQIPDFFKEPNFLERLES